MNEILRNISDNHNYDILHDLKYSMNLDNFLKICILSYRINAKLPIIIEGETGVGKTALLQHMCEKVFNYKFMKYDINAGISENRLQ